LLVTAEDPMTGAVTHTNTAYFVYVALDVGGETAEVPPLIFETEQEKRLFDEGAARQAKRLESRRQERMLGP
jgi:acyl-CoA hydrolase